MSPETPSPVKDWDVEHAEAQATEALQYLQTDPASLRFPWHGVDAIVGPIQDHYLVLIGADTGSGKTTVLMHLLHRWHLAGHRVCLLSLEFDPYLLRLYWACLASGVDPRPIIRGQTTPDTLPPAHRAAIQSQLVWQTGAGASLVRFSVFGALKAAELPGLFEEAKGSSVLLIDHLQAIDVGGLGNGYERYARLCRHLKELVREYRIPTIAAAQFHRDKTFDRLAPYLPPRETAFYGGHILLQQADVALGLYRPLRPGVTKGQMLELRAGLGSLQEAITHDTVGVVCLKHRWDDQRGGRSFLRYRDGILTDEWDHESPPPVAPDCPVAPGPSLPGGPGGDGDPTRT